MLRSLDCSWIESGRIRAAKCSVMNKDTMKSKLHTADSSSFARAPASPLSDVLSSRVRTTGPKSYLKVV